MCVITLADYSIHCTYMKHTKLGKELQRLMKLHGFTYRRLHDVTGVNESQIRYIIRLGGTPTNATAEKLDKALPGFFDYLQNVWRPMQEAAAEKDLEEDACASVEAGTPPAKRERLIPLIDSWAIHDLPAEGYDTESFNDQMADYCVSEWVLPPAGMPLDDDDFLYCTHVEDSEMRLLPVGTLVYAKRNQVPVPGDYVVARDAESMTIVIRQFKRKKDKDTSVIAADNGESVETGDLYGVVVAWTVVLQR